MVENLFYDTACCQRLLSLDNSNIFHLSSLGVLKNQVDPKQETRQFTYKPHRNVTLASDEVTSFPRQDVDLGASSMHTEATKL